MHNCLVYTILSHISDGHPSITNSFVYWIFSHYSIIARFSWSDNLRKEAALCLSVSPTHLSPSHDTYLYLIWSINQYRPASVRNNGNTIMIKCPTCPTRMKWSVNNSAYILADRLITNMNWSKRYIKYVPYHRVEQQHLCCSTNHKNAYVVRLEATREVYSSVAPPSGGKYLWQGNSLIQIIWPSSYTVCQ